MRTETDSLGEVQLEDSALWGAQTQRTLTNFAIGTDTIPLALVRALVQVKRAAARCNKKHELIEHDLADWIDSACDEVLNGRHDNQFPLSVFHSGSGTQANMNVNEVIANLACKIAGHEPGNKHPVHPNDHVNCSQSSNDVFPTAMHIAAYSETERHLLPAMDKLASALEDKAQDFDPIIKIGRTHMMDATPLTLGNEFSGYAAQLRFCIAKVRESLADLQQLAIGGTAVGTGLNTPEGWAPDVTRALSEQTGISFRPADNRYMALSSQHGILQLSGACRQLASALMIIGNNIRLLASGPRCGLAEIRLPANEPGSSIMPGKVNPTQCEALCMVAAQVTGLDAAIQCGASQGHLQLNVFRPMMIDNLLKAVRLLGDACTSFTDHCVTGIEANEDNIRGHLSQSLMLVTALAPEIGYDQAASYAKQAYEQNKTLKDVVLADGKLDEAEFDRLCDPAAMIPGR